MKLRPTLSKAVSTPAHAKHLEASCTEGEIPIETILDEGNWLPPISVYVSTKQSVAAFPNRLS
jgi:hypothetical protein